LLKQRAELRESPLRTVSTFEMGIIDLVDQAFKFQLPQIVRNMGFTSTNAQLLTAPPYLLGAINAVFVSWLADRFTLRSPFILGPQMLVVVAYAVLFVKAANIADNIPVCYAMVSLACMGIYPIIPGKFFMLPSFNPRPGFWRRHG
jgi:cyanate permease